MPRPMQMAELSHCEECRRILRSDRCRRSTCDAAWNDNEEQHIEQDVQQYRRGEVVQGACRIAERSQNRRCRVIDELREHSAERDAQIECRLRDQLLWRCKRREHLRGEEQPCRRECHGKDEHRDRDGLYECIQTGVFLFPIEMGDEDGEPRRKSDEEIDNDR